jgi:gliding motility-associated protein GldM
MAHGKETPRQKMIGMMYLVLTALLALNVSKDILNAFVLVDDSLTITTESFSQKNKLIYDEFDKAAAMVTRARPFKDKAVIVRKEADELYNYINSLKVRLVKLVDGNEALAVEKDKISPVKVNAKDNTDKPAQVMIGDNNNGEAKKLRAKIAAFRESLLKMIDDKKKDITVVNSIEKNLNTADPPTEEGGSHEIWESYYFEHRPLIAVTTIMSTMQSNIRNAESEITKYLFNKIDAGSTKFNKLEGITIPNSNYILKGNEYSAEVFLAATDTTQKPVITVGNVKTTKLADGSYNSEIVGGGEVLQINEKGRGVYKRPCGAIGNMKWGGIIQIKRSDGQVINTPFNAEYQVAEASTVISPTKMNVFYLGVDNPVDVSVPGVPSDKVFPSINNGVIVPNGKSSWIVRPRNEGKATITVQAEFDKKRKDMGSMLFHVKTIPDPIPKVAGKKGGSIDRNTLAAQSVVLADLENFDFETSFRVIEFTVSASIKGFNREELVKSNKISDAQRDIINMATRGQKIYFDNIKAIGPDGRPRELPTLSFKIQ